MLNECEGCGTRFAHDLLVCPHCGAPWTPAGPTPAEPAGGRRSTPATAEAPAVEGGDV